jgi:hypothetical protein
MFKICKAPTSIAEAGMESMEFEVAKAWLDANQQNAETPHANGEHGVYWIIPADADETYAENHPPIAE